MADMDKRRANEKIKSLLKSERAYAVKLFGGVNVWLRNTDRSLDPRHDGPLLLAQAPSYREAVDKVSRGIVHLEVLEVLSRPGLPPLKRG